MPSQPAWVAPRHVALLIAAYLLVHLGVRIWMGPTLGLDDAEQALFAQHWLPNYRFRAPPLFTWVLVAASGLTDVGMLAISLIRYVLLAMVLGFTYLTARRLIRDPSLAALATFSFTAVYVFGYYSHHDLTHTTTLSAFLAASWYVFVRLAATPTLPWYLALGLCFGLGILGKWNFAMFALALPLACLARPAYRRLVLDWRIVPAALVAAAIALPSILWALNAGPATGDAVGSLLGRQGGGFLLGLAKGTADLALAVLTFPLPFLAIFLLVFGTAAWRGLRTPEPTASAAIALVPGTAFVGTAIAIGIGLHWLLVPLAGATDFDERLLQPALQVLPIYVFMLVERAGCATLGAVRTYATAIAAVAIVALVARVGIHMAGADACRRICRTLVPFDAIATGLRDAGFRGNGTIVVRDVHLAGNLRVQFPAARVMETGYPPRVWPRPGSAGQCIAVWSGDSAPGAVDTYLAQQLRVPQAASRREGMVSALMRGSETRSYRVSYRLYDGAQGDCR